MCKRHFFGTLAITSTICLFFVWHKQAPFQTQSQTAKPLSSQKQARFTGAKTPRTEPVPKEENTLKLGFLELTKLQSNYPSL
jgi:hypothetical protein